MYFKIYFQMRLCLNKISSKLKMDVFYITNPHLPNSELKDFISSSAEERFASKSLRLLPLLEFYFGRSILNNILYCSYIYSTKK